MKAMFVQTTTARLSSMWAGSHNASLRVMTPPHLLSSGVRTQINGWSCYFADFFFFLYGQKPWRSSTKYISIFKAFNVFPQPVKAECRPLKSGSFPPPLGTSHSLWRYPLVFSSIVQGTLRRLPMCFSAQWMKSCAECGNVRQCHLNINIFRDL